MTDRILVHRCGTLGDTVISLPIFHLLRRRFPQAEIRLLTDHAGPTDSKNKIRSHALLSGSGLFDGYFTYPGATRSIGALSRLIREIRAWRPDMLVYLPPFPGLRKTFRDLSLFWLCGIRRYEGVPIRRALRQHPFNQTEKIFESEASRLARCVAPLGAIDLNDLQNWSLNHTDQERTEADSILSNWPGRFRYIAMSLGASSPCKDWGDANWQNALAGIARLTPGAGLLLVGGKLDHERSEGLLAEWPGPRLNTCGLTSPRVSALLLAEAIAYLGHDSGPMHLAGSVGTSCVCVFSRHQLPGWWFPPGTQHRILYPRLPDGALYIEENGIDEIRAEDVINAFKQVVAGANLSFSAERIAAVG